MPRRPELEPLLTSKGWMVSVPPLLSPDGRRRRHYFPPTPAGKKQAQKFGGQVRAVYHRGERGTLLRPEDSFQAAEALKLLAPTGLSLVEAARAARERWEARGSSETFKERWLSFTARMEEHWRPRYEQDMGKIPRWVTPEFMKLRLHEITPEVLRAAVTAAGPLAPGTIKARETRIRSVLAGRGGRRRAVKVALLSREELARLKWAARRDPETRRAVGLLLYAGIRPAAEEGEITRLDWSAVGKEEIYVAHEVSKTGSDRHIPLGRRLRWWIREHPPEGPVCPAWWKVKWQRLRREAGIGAGQDLTRHTFASHYLAVHGELETKMVMGHTAGSDTLLRHYRRAVTRAQGRRYFGACAKDGG